MTQETMRAACAARRLVAALLGAMALVGGGLCTSATAQGFPGKPVRLVSPYPPGAGSGDLTARAVAAGLSEIWGQPVVVETKPGANEIIAAESVAHAAPDGYTLLLASDATLLYNAYFYKRLPYDTAKDLAPISRVGLGRMVLAVNSSVPVNTLGELVAYAKQNPGKLTFGSGGTGGMTHLALEGLKKDQGVDITHIPYKGTALVIQDMLAGSVQMTVAAPNAVAQFVQSGRMKALAISGPRRAATLPATPTFAEAGVPGVTADYMFALAAPGQTPPAIVDKIAADLARVVASQAFRDKVLVPAGIEPGAETPAQFNAFLRSERPRAADKVKSSGVVLD